MAGCKLLCQGMGACDKGYGHLAGGAIGTCGRNWGHVAGYGVMWQGWWHVSGCWLMWQGVGACHKG